MLLLAETPEGYEKHAEWRFRGNNTDTPFYTFCLNGVDQHLKHLSMEKAGWAAMQKPDLFGMSERRRDDDEDDGDSRNGQRAQRVIKWGVGWLGCRKAKLSETAEILAV